MSRAIGFLLLSGEIALVDEEDAHLLRLRWTLRRTSSGGAYVRRCDGRVIHQHVNTPKLLHRAISTCPGQPVDHINGDTLDNRRANLRLVSGKANRRNVGQSQQNSGAGFIGVTWNAGRGKWAASIRVNGKLLHLGLFTDFDAAVAARAVAEIEHWGIEPRRAVVIDRALRNFRGTNV